MKTKKLIRLSIVLLSVVAFTFTSCKKDDLSNGKANPASLVQLTADENEVENVMNDAEGDISSVMANPGGGYKSGNMLPCNTTIDSLAVANDTITIFITYNGPNCSGRLIRTGKIEIKKKVGTYWQQVGTGITYNYINYKVTRVATNKSVTLNGTKTFVNVSGGHRWQVGTMLTSYIERVTGSMQTSFDNGTSRTWNVARQLTYTGGPGHFILTIDGFGTANDYQNLVVWGTNRQGEDFFTQITQSVVCKEVCDWNPVSGIKIHQIPADNKSATITFGFDSNNQPITGDDCPTRYRVDWQKNNQSGTSYFPL